MFKLYEYLNKYGFNTYKKILEKVSELPLKDIAIHMEKLYIDSLEIETDNQNAVGLYDFSANDSLSGSPHPCAEITCRLRNVNDLVSFSLLYSDSILIINPLEFVYYYSIGKKVIKSKHDENIFRNECLVSLIILLSLEFAIDERKIMFTRLNFGLCKKCLNQVKRTEKNTEKVLENSSKYVSFALKNNIKVTMINPKSVLIKGLGKFISEDSIVLTFQNLPKYLTQYSKKAPINLPVSSNEIFVKKFINEAINNLFMQKDSLFRIGKRTYLTNNSIETEILNNISIKTDITGYSKNLIKGLIHSAPFIRNIDPKKIIKIRKDNNEQFEQYRNSIKKVVISTENSKSPKDFSEAFDDIVKPELEKLKNEVFIKQSDYMEKNLKGSTVSLIYIGIGLSLQNLPILTHGLAKGAKTAIEGVIDQHNLKHELSKNNYYFLWKLKEEAKKINSKSIINPLD